MTSAETGSADSDADAAAMSSKGNAMAGFQVVVAELQSRLDIRGEGSIRVGSGMRGGRRNGGHGFPGISRNLRFTLRRHSISGLQIVLGQKLRRIEFVPGRPRENTLQPPVQRRFVDENGFADGSGVDLSFQQSAQHGLLLA